MTKKDIAELFKFIRSIYPNFEVDQYKIDAWSKMLKDQNPATVMKNAERYALEKTFAPTIADLRERRRYEDKPALAGFWGPEDYE